MGKVDVKISHLLVKMIGVPFVAIHFDFVSLFSCSRTLPIHISNAFRVLCSPVLCVYMFAFAMAAIAQLVGQNAAQNGNKVIELPCSIIYGLWIGVNFQIHQQ